MKRVAIVGLFVALVALWAPQPAKAHVHVAVGIGLPFFGAVVATPPVYYPPAFVPAPVYAPAPVFYGGPVYRPCFPRYRAYGRFGYYRPYYRGRYWH